MTLTRAFKDTVIARAQRDERFAWALRDEAIRECVDGDLHVGMDLLRDIADARRFARGRLEREAAKLDPVEERAIVEGAIGEDPTSDPQDY